MDDANGVPQDDNTPAESSGRRRGSSAPTETRTIGNMLKTARETSGMTLAEIAERTKIRPGILTAIEADDHDHLPALTYSLGFVKAFARTVGMDPIEAADRYRLESHKGDPVPTMVDLQPLEEKRLPTRGILFGSIAAVIILLALFWAWGAGAFDSETPANPVEAVAAPEATPEGAVDIVPEPAAAPNPSAPVTLTAKEEVWLRISDSQETFFMGTMAAGQVMTLPQGRPWLLRTGKAGALEARVGNTVVPPLGGPVEQVRNVSLKPEDLLARGVAVGGITLPSPLPGAAVPQPGIVPPPAG